MGISSENQLDKVQKMRELGTFSPHGMSLSVPFPEEEKAGRVEEPEVMPNTKKTGL